LAEPFLDINVLLRHVLNDDPVQSPRATALLLAIQRGERSAQLSEPAIFETVFSLQRKEGFDRRGISRRVLALMLLPGIGFSDKGLYWRVFDLYRTRPGLSFPDCYHVALMERQGGSAIFSFDRGFDRVPGVHRIEP
jgi:predicted nucleic acid-binding protein